MLGWRRYVPESIGLVLLLVCADRLFFDGSLYMGFAPRPLWIPVVLISAQYGLAGGMFATIVATLALYSSTLPSQLANQDYYAYLRLIVAEPTGWLACALVLGGLRSLHIFHATALRQQRDDALIEVDAVARSFSEALAEIGRLELRIAGETQTICAVGQAFGRLDARDRPRLAASIAEIGRLVVGTTALTIYERAENGLVALATSGGCSPSGLEEIPSLSLDVASRLRDAPNSLWRCDLDAEDNRLPPGATIVIGIRAPGQSELRGLLVADRLLPNQDFSEAVERAQDVARGLGGVLTGARP